MQNSETSHTPALYLRQLLALICKGCPASPASTFTWKPDQSGSLVASCSKEGKLLLNQWGVSNHSPLRVLSIGARTSFGEKTNGESLLQGLLHSPHPALLTSTQPHGPPASFLPPAPSPEYQPSVFQGLHQSSSHAPLMPVSRIPHTCVDSYNRQVLS